MAFKKAKCEQKYIKVGVYGTQGSGKTFTTLLMAEGLAKRENKKIAYVDTESGTDFYTLAIPERKVHPLAFEFDAIYTKSLAEIIKEVKSIDFNEYGVIVIDSITHLWEAAREAYSGFMTKTEGIPLNAWGPIKKPYKGLINFLLNCDAHVFIVGREGLRTENDGGDLSVIGTKMKSEGETPYEPHILINMKQIRRENSVDKLEKGDIVAYFEKDRTGLFEGKTIRQPNYQTLIPLVNILIGEKQRKIDTDDIIAEKDSGLITNAREEKEKVSKECRINAIADISKCESLSGLSVVWQGIKQSKMYTDDRDIVVSYKDEKKVILAEKEIKGE